MSESSSRSELFVPSAVPNESALPLRLVAFPGGIGIELDRPFSLPPVTVEELAWALPGLRLPVDLSGGVRSFRHRRGEVERMALSLVPEQLAAWLEARARSVFTPTPGSLRVWLLGEGLGIGMHSSTAALAFDLLWAPRADEARWVVAEPRTAGDLAGPSIVHALRFCDAVFGGLVERTGRVLSFGKIVSRLAHLLLPPAGVRLPGAGQLTFGQLSMRGERLHVDAERGRPELIAAERATRALEFAKLVKDADALLEAGDTEQARGRYLVALEHAPRHPELCHSVAAIDKDLAERYEAALGLLVESLPAVEFGLVGAELLARVGDFGGAAMAVTKQASRERYAPLAALLWVRLAELTDSAAERAGYLDQALACSPSCQAARWARFELRTSGGDLNGALADAEHLEAAASGNQARHEVVLGAADHLQRAGLFQPAGRLFERALRYLPRDARANLGLAEALLSLAKPERAFTLLERAHELSSTDSEVQARAGLLLAKLLAEHYRDLPQAIVRARSVTGQTFCVVEARALEATWRAHLGDIVGAEQAYARMRDTLELSHGLHAERATPWLVAAAKFASERGEPRAAERHLAVALRLAPRDPGVLAAYRAVGLLRANAATPVVVTPLQATDTIEAEPERVHSEPAVDDLALERRVEQLKGELAAQSAPSAQLLEELGKGLGRLGRDAELYALLQARYEDAAPPVQQLLKPELVQVLTRLVEELRESSPEEAAVYEYMRGQLTLESA